MKSTRTKAKAPAKKPAAKRMPISVMTLARASSPRRTRQHPFTVAPYPPGVVPRGTQTMAKDEAIQGSLAWAASAVTSAFEEGLTFLGYAYLAELAQRPEYRCISETIATEMTRKWIKIQSKGDEDKTAKIKVIETAMERLQVRDVFRKMAEQDGFFGRSHLYLDTGQTDDREELKTPIGTGRDSVSTSKVAKGGLRRLKAVEAVWCYPSNYNSNDPLKPDWYKPSMWFVNGKEIHASRLLTFIGREVPDLLKPAYSFGGLSLSQMAKPYVDNWLRTRQSVADLIHAFSVFVLATDMQQALQSGGGEEFFNRLDLFNRVRDNLGAMAINKDTEDLKNVSAPLGTLDILQAQTQEHMAAVSGIPLVKLLGIQPAGLNADSDGIMRCFYDRILAHQEAFFRPNLTTVIDFIQLSEFGEVDPDIGYAFEPLWSLDAKAEAEKRRAEADTDAEYLDRGVLDPKEVRKKLASTPDSPYASIDVDVIPEPPDSGEDDDTPADGDQPRDEEAGTGEPKHAAAA